MSSTHLSLHVHVVFSTKNRKPLIDSEWRERLHAYVGGVVRENGVVAKCVGGVEDHLHILLELRATHRLADIMREIKAASSAWVHREIGLQEFRWQDGYGAFTVSPRRRSAVVRYINNQEHHHQRESFEKEYVRVLREAEVVYDPKYLW